MRIVRGRAIAQPPFALSTTCPLSVVHPAAAAAAEAAAPAPGHADPPAGLPAAAAAACSPWTPLDTVDGLQSHGKRKRGDWTGDETARDVRVLTGSGEGCGNGANGSDDDAADGASAAAAAASAASSLVLTQMLALHAAAAESLPYAGLSLHDKHFVRVALPHARAPPALPPSLSSTSSSYSSSRSMTSSSSLLLPPSSSQPSSAAANAHHSSPLLLQLPEHVGGKAQFGTGAGAVGATPGGVGSASYHLQQQQQPQQQQQKQQQQQINQQNQQRRNQQEQGRRLGEGADLSPASSLLAVSQPIGTGRAKGPRATIGLNSISYNIGQSGGRGRGRGQRVT